jgi:hypothetical protein
MRRFHRLVPLAAFLLIPGLLDGAPDRIIPAVASAPGVSGGTWRTLLLLHNASEASSRVSLTFHYAGQEAQPTDPVASHTLLPGETQTVTDLLRDDFKLSAVSGSLDVAATEGTLPVIQAIVYHEGAGGEMKGVNVPAVKPSEALTKGERAVLLFPGTGDFRLNVGARSVGGPAALTFTVKDSRGVVRGTGQRSLRTDEFLQKSASEFTGTTVVPGDSILCQVTSGYVLVYATPIDNRSDDGSYQAAERVAPAAVPIDMTSDFTPPTGREGDAPGGPGVSRLMMATSSDGLAFTRTNQIVTDQGDVPDLLVDSRGWVYLYYVGWTLGNEKHKLCVAISRDGGKTWIYKKAVFTGFEGMVAPVDPDIQLLPDGTYRLYVTSAENGDWSKARSYYAEGTDGIHFAKRGLSFAPPVGLSLDPSSIKIGETWHLFAGGNPGLNLHATSLDGKTFTFVEEIAVKKDGVNQMMANGIAVPGGYRFYTFDAIPPGPGQSQGINSVFSTDGLTWTADPGKRLTIDTAGGKESNAVKDPAAVRLLDGTYLMVYSTRIP